MAARPGVSRRAVFTGMSLCCAPAFARRACATGKPEAAEVTEVAPGIFVRNGVTADATAANDDAIANTGFIVGRDAIAVFDPGGGLHDGESLRLAIRQRSALPVRYVIMSHVHPDHIFGASAFDQENPIFVGHADLPGELAARGAFYRQGLDAILGAGRAGSIVIPTLLVRGEKSLDLGNRSLVLTAHAPAHTHADLSVRDPQTCTLLTGDLLFVNRVPSLDGDLKGWLAQLDRLKATAAPGTWKAVPGHGPVSVAWPQAAADLERYLTTLLRETRQAIAKAIPIDRAAATVALSERDRWALFDDYNARNVIEAYRQLEWE